MLGIWGWVMTVARLPGYTVRYFSNRIVLDGNVGAIHAEADKILKRFACSALPYCVVTDTSQHIVLKARH